ncbi:hypothetical protein ES703_87215 [subsurface metagenome]
MLVKMVSAVVKRMIHFDVLLGDDFVIFNYLQLAYVIADDSLVPQHKFVFTVDVAGVTLESILRCYSAIRVLNLHFKSRVIARFGVVIYYSTLNCYLEVLECPYDCHCAKIGTQGEVAANFDRDFPALPLVTLDPQVFRLVIFYSEVFEFYEKRQFSVFQHNEVFAILPIVFNVSLLIYGEQQLSEFFSGSQCHPILGGSFIDYDLPVLDFVYPEQLLLKFMSGVRAPHSPCQNEHAATVHQQQPGHTNQAAK